MADTNEYGYYAKRKSEEAPPPRRRSPLRGPLSFFLIVAAIVLFMSIFFSISKIEVKGNSLYTDNEIINASGIQEGDNLFFVNRIAAGSRVVAKLPYVDSVSITRGLPSSVTIVVEESAAVGYVIVGDEYWTLSQSGKYLGTIEKSAAGKVARISGITAAEPAVGDELEAIEGEELRLEYLLALAEQIKGRGLAADVTAIDVSDPQNATIEYQGRFTVKFGENKDVEYKFGKLLSAVSQLNEDDGGLMDLSDGNKVYYNPN